MSLPLTVALYALIPFAAAPAGAMWSAFRNPGDRTRSAMQHTAAGILFAAVGLEILAEERTHARLPVIIGFVLGLVCMLLLRAWGEPRKESGAGLLATAGVDFFIDGLVLGAGFTAEARTGILLTVALTLEVLFLGLSIAATIARRGATRGRTIGVTTALAALMVLGAWLGAVVFPLLSPFVFTVVLGFATVALLYLVIEELLVEAHEVQETPLSAAMFFVGVLVFLMVEMSASPALS